MQLPCLMQLVQEGLHRERPEEGKENETAGETWSVSKEEKGDGRGAEATQAKALQPVSLEDGSTSGHNFLL